MKKVLWILRAASFTFAQSTSESDIILEKAREKILAVAQRLTRYTCLQTINREYFAVASPVIRGKLLTAAGPRRACSATLDQPADDLTLASEQLRFAADRPDCRLRPDQYRLVRNV